MNYFPEDRGAELRALFFESAAEILQALNEAGLELEARPTDEEVLRRVRRSVHTLKGDSAACGFHQISDFAHEIEDILTPQVALAHGAKLAEVVLAVADSGCGIEEADLARIFARFSRAKPYHSRDVGGFGLGLPTVRAIAEAHKGSVQVRSTVGHGSTFELRIPATAAQA